jgi:hypothetical protein
MNGADMEARPLAGERQHRVRVGIPRNTRMELAACAPSFASKATRAASTPSREPTGREGILLHCRRRVRMDAPR